jgi:hypothetical protein
MGTMPNTSWGDNEPRNVYLANIKTPRGEMDVTFWDSLHNTKMSKITMQDYWRNSYFDKYKKKYKQLIAEAKPTPYDILACLQKYDVGSFSDFCCNFDYSTDSISAFNVYIACENERRDVRRIFTPEQLKALEEIG